MEYTMEATINRNLLKFAVQTALTCPKCGQILDMRRAVQFGLAGREFILCCACYDKLECERLDNNFTPFAEVLDGRVLFGEAEVVRTKPRRRNAPHSRQSLKRR